jgi:hypothetical protein
MIPKRPTEQSDPHWPEKWEANEYAVAKRAVDALREVVEGMQIETSDHEFVGELAQDALDEIEASGWKP